MSPVDMFQTRYRVALGSALVPVGNGGELPCTPMLPLSNCAAAGATAARHRSRHNAAALAPATTRCRRWLHFSRSMLPSMLVDPLNIVMSHIVLLLADYGTIVTTVVAVI